MIKESCREKVYLQPVFRRSVCFVRDRRLAGRRPIWPPSSQRRHRAASIYFASFLAAAILAMSSSASSSVLLDHACVRQLSWQYPPFSFVNSGRPAHGSLAMCARCRERCSKMWWNVEVRSERPSPAFASKIRYARRK